MKDAPLGSWPPLAYEEHPWTPDAHASRTAARQHSGPYTAAITPPIADADLELDMDVLADIDDATRAITAFDTKLGANGGVPLAPLSAILLRTESASSSQIENLTVGARQLALASIGHASSRNAGVVTANVAAMDAALSLSENPGIESVLAMHEALLREAWPEQAGRLRNQQVWIGGSAIGPHRATFVPPHHTRVSAAMDDLIEFVDRDDIPPLAHAAVAHAQFETIHPFVDGNGRTGRALVHSMLRTKGVTQSVAVPVSAGLLTDTAGYFGALGSYRAGDPNPIVSAFAHASRFGAVEGQRLVDDLEGVRVRQREWIVARSDAAAWRLHDHLTGQPVVDTAHVARSLQVSERAAHTAIDTLVEAGVLRETTKKTRGRVWQSDAVLEVLDDFAEKIRRTRGRL